MGHSFLPGPASLCNQHQAKPFQAINFQALKSNKQAAGLPVMTHLPVIVTSSQTNIPSHWAAGLAATPPPPLVQTQIYHQTQIYTSVPSFKHKYTCKYTHQSRRTQHKNMCLHLETHQKLGRQVQPQRLQACLGRRRKGRRDPRLEGQAKRAPSCQCLRPRTHSGRAAPAAGGGSQLCKG